MKADTPLSFRSSSMKGPMTRAPERCPHYGDEFFRNRLLMRNCRVRADISICGWAHVSM
jgi:hypothetical protein